MFRKAALAKLASPEQLDRVMQVTTPKSWVALTAIIVLLLVAIFWGILGRTAERVNGAGILLTAGGILPVESRGAGIIAEVLVNVGDEVKEGQVVVKVTQRTSAEEIRQTQAQIEELRANRERSLALIQRNRDAELASLREERSRLSNSTQALRNQISFLDSRLAAQQEAFKHGLVIRDQVQATSQELAAARANLIASQAQEAQLLAREASTKNQTETTIFNLDQELRRSERQLEMQELRFTEGTQILSPYTGRVMSRIVDPGQEVRSGQAVLFLELSHQPLEVVAFIPLQGARLRAGLVAQMSPEGVVWEEYGYMLGDVTGITQGPASPDTMNRVLRNQTLITQFTQSGSVYEVRIRPRVDLHTPSGFQWTSRQGPALKFGSGTLLRVQIPVNERRPIEMVVPTVRKWLGV